MNPTELYTKQMLFQSIVETIRGRVIHACIDIEFMIDGYIAEHFCNTQDKVDELASLILMPRVSWNDKVEIFSVLIEKYNKQFNTSYPDYKKDIIDLIEKRNQFAHFPSNNTIEGIRHFDKTGNIQFLKFKNFKEKVTKDISYQQKPEYSHEEIKNYIAAANKYSKAISLELRMLKQSIENP